MNLSPDYLVERKNNKKEITKWRVIAFVAIALSIIAFGARNKIFGASDSVADQHIASVLIDGVIFEDAKRDEKLEEIINNDDIKALIVKINSPGGTVVGSEMIFNILRKIAAKKPVVAVLGTLAASGGYLISLGADYILAHNGTITGSIGVVFQTAEITELGEKLGIKFHNFKSGELKAAPNPLEKLTEKVKDATMENVYDNYDYFIELVAQRRGLQISEVRKLADGRIYSGRQAVKLKLVDQIGDVDSAQKWLQDVKHLDASLKVKEFKLKPEPQMLDILLGDLNNMISVKLPSMLQEKFGPNLMSKIGL